MTLNRKVLTCYSEDKEAIFLDFMPCRSQDYEFIYDFYEETSIEFLRIYQTDYTKLLVPRIRTLFPLVDPVTHEVQTDFDVCFDNVFSQSDWKKMLELLRLEMASTTIKQERDFYASFLLWNSRQLTWADMLMVEGNQ